MFAQADLTFAATDVFLAAAGFLVTPTGFAPTVLVVVAFLGPRFAPVFAVARFFVPPVVTSATVGKTRGREFPVSEVQHRSKRLRAG